VPVFRPRDPNDKLAPAGYGDAAFVLPDNSLAYTVRFENQSDANAPAREIVVTDILDADVDSFEMTEIAFADQRIAVPAGLSHYETTVAMTANATPIRVEVTTDLDRDTRQFTLSLRAVDPLTGWSPEDPLVGFLYPNDSTGRGQGSVSYRVKPKIGLPSGTEITNRARIYFDTNDPIDTPLVRNTLDAAGPTSQVAALPATSTSPTFNVTWSGQDDANGSGIASYDLYVSQDGGIFAAYITGTPLTSFTFTVDPGHTYAFYTVATDNVGHRESKLAQAEATTRIENLPTTTVLSSDHSDGSVYGQLITFTATVSSTILNAGVPTGSVQFVIDGSNFESPVPLTNGVGTIGTTSLLADSHSIGATYIGENQNFAGSTSVVVAQPVDPAALTITADDQSQVYGAAVPALTARYTGLVNADTPVSLTTLPTLTTTATAASHVGSYPITVSGAASPNYTISFVDGTLTVTAAALTVTADNQSKVYGAALPELTATYAGLVNGDTPASLTAPPALATTAGHVGTYPITASGAASTDYTISYVDATLAVNPALLTITASDKTKVYGDPLPELTASFAGFVSGDTPASLTTPPTLVTTATVSSHVGSYPITVSGAADADYSISYVAGTLTVTPAPLTITADNKTKVFWAPLPALTARYVGLVNGDTLANLTAPPALATTAQAASPVGSYPLTASGAAAADYTISYVAGSLTVVDCGWWNPVNPYDVTGEGKVEAIDVLYVVNYINSHPGDRSLPPSPASPPPFYNVSGDDAITALDVLMVINYVNTHPVGQSEGESAAVLGAALPIGKRTEIIYPLHVDRSLRDRVSRLGETRPRGLIGGDYVGQASSPEIPATGSVGAAGLNGSSQPLSTAVAWPVHSRTGEQNIRRRTRQTRQPAELDFSALGIGDLEPVLEMFADTVAATWVK
jgi:MBG domain (YGX type)/Bacterial Ig-like domain (group 3)/Dockerin type I domain